MKIRGFALAAAVVFATFSSAPSLADGTDIEVLGSGIVDNAISVVIHNTDDSPDTARIAVTVHLLNGSTQVLTSPNITLGGQQVASVTLVATGQIVAIGDDIEPYPPM